MQSPWTWVVQIVGDSGAHVPARAYIFIITEIRELAPWSAYLLTLVALASGFLVAWPHGVILPRLADLLERAWKQILRRPLVWIGAMVAFAFAFGGYVHYQVYGGIPHVQDEIAYVFQARLLARGKFYVPVPPEDWWPGLGFNFCPAFRGRWFGYPPFGFPLVLVAGALTDLEGLVNPLLNALALVCFYGCLRAYLSREKALLAATLMGFSPFFLFMGASLLSHSLMLLLTTGGLYLHSREARGERSTVVFLALSAVGAFGWNVRPLTAAAFLGSLWIDLAVRRLRPLRLRDLLLGSLIGLMGVAAGLGYNLAVTGDPLISPQVAAFPTINFGFGHYFYEKIRTVHGPVAAFGNLLVNLYSLDVYLLGLPLMGLGLPLLGLPRAWRVLPRAWFLGAALTVIGYMGWFYPGTCFGPRFYYELMPLLCVAAACGLMALRRTVRSRLPFHLPTFLVLLGLGVFGSTVPNRLRQLPGYWGVYPEALHYLESLGISGRVIKVVPDLHVTFFLQTSPFFEGENLFWSTKFFADPPQDFLDLRGGQPAIRFPLKDWLGPELYRTYFPPEEGDPFAPELPHLAKPSSQGG